MQISIEYLFLFILAVSALVLVLLIYVIILRRRVTSIFKGESDASLDKIIHAQEKRTDRLEQEVKRHLEEIRDLGENLRRAFQKVEILRYNSFEESGGQQSFSLVALDGSRDGIILTVLQLRDTMKMYVKQVEGGRLRQALSREEEQVLQKALQSL